MEDKSKYFVVKQRAVPEVLLKVVRQYKGEDYYIGSADG